MKLQKDDFNVFKIVGDGMMSSVYIAEGRLIPAIIIDTLDNKDIPDLIKMHHGNQPGDVASQFVRKIFDKNIYLLTLNFTKPIAVSFAIEFILPEHYSLIDGILQSKGLYLLTGKRGDRVSQNIEDSILLEIPNGGFENSWDEVLRRVLMKSLKDTSLSKKERKELAKENIIRMREVWNFRRSDT